MHGGHADDIGKVYRYAPQAILLHTNRKEQPAKPFELGNTSVNAYL